MTELIVHDQPVTVRMVPFPAEAVNAGAALLAVGIVVDSAGG